MERLHRQKFLAPQPADSGPTRRDFLALSGASALFAVLTVWGGRRVGSGISSGEVLKTCTGDVFVPGSFGRKLADKQAKFEAVTKMVLEDKRITENESIVLVSSSRRVTEYQKSYEQCWSDIWDVFNKTILPAGGALLTGFLARTRYQDYRATTDIDIVS